MIDFLEGVAGADADGFSQAECEAFVDAVVYSMLIDRRIREGEERELARQLKRLPWVSEVDLTDYVKQSSLPRGKIFRSS